LTYGYPKTVPGDSLGVPGTVVTGRLPVVTLYWGLSQFVGIDVYHSIAMGISVQERPIILYLGYRSKSKLTGGLSVGLLY